MKIKKKFKHVDFITDVIGEGIVPTTGYTVTLEYKYQGMTYSREFTKDELGLCNKPPTLCQCGNEIKEGDPYDGYCAECG